MVFDQLHRIAHSRGYWLSLAALGLTFLAVALFYQHVLEELPCVLCIQVRIWVAAFTLIALLALLPSGKRLRIAAHLLSVACFAALVERSYQLLGTERGFIFGDCGFDLGLPSWLALDTWFPAIFRVENSCGYTPELIFGITMAEALIVSSVILLFIGLTLTISALMRRQD